MKLFTAVNKKIKFSEKDYVERNYIRDDGKAVIPVEVRNLDDIYMKHDYKKLVLSDDITNYINEVASIIPFKYDIVIEFHCHELSVDEQERMKKIVKNNFGMEIDDIDYKNRMNIYVSILLFVIGAATLILGYALEDKILKILDELIVITGWVVLWDMMEVIIFTNNERKIEKLNKLQLYDSKVEFVFDK